MSVKKSPVPKANAILDERRATGREMRIRVHGAGFVDATDAQIDPFLKMYYDLTEEFCWGTVWARDGLPIKERSMLAMSITATKGQQPAVAQHVATALRAGWSREQIGEILLHVYCYAGCYAALGAFRTASEVFKTRDAGPDAAPQIVEPRGPEEIPLGSSEVSDSVSALAARGTRIRRELFGEDGGGFPRAGTDDDLMTMFMEAADEFGFGSVWARPMLTPRHRMMLSLAITATLNQDDAVRQYVLGCRRCGLGTPEVGEVLLQVFVYAGMHASMTAFRIARESLGEGAEDDTSAVGQ